MRVNIFHSIGLILFLSTPALSQVQQNDPNAANASFAYQGDMRALHQNNVSNYNTLNMQIQRGIQSNRASYYGYLNSGIAERSLSRGISRRSHIPTGRGFNSSVCIGC
ncbi:hypothetical protein FV223_00630 [Methylobacterium sp. WL116]|nr:hypothetical protein FV223_00630 [Methylobacterium sp. WL116]